MKNNKTALWSLIMAGVFGLALLVSIGFNISQSARVAQLEKNLRAASSDIESAKDKSDSLSDEIDSLEASNSALQDGAVEQENSSAYNGCLLYAMGYFDGQGQESTTSVSMASGFCADQYSKMTEDEFNELYTPTY